MIVFKINTFIIPNFFHSPVTTHDYQKRYASHFSWHPQEEENDDDKKKCPKTTPVRDGSEENTTMQRDQPCVQTMDMDTPKVVEWFDSESS